jgi:N12 class adenine-specific DNA methylase
MQKESTILEGKYGQFHHENRTWERLLEFFKQENAFLKNRLSEVVDHKTDKDFLAMAEHFQNSFIVKDEFIDELRHDVHEQEEMLKNLVKGDDKKSNEKFFKKQDKLRNEIEYLEKDFTKIKNEFNKYLSLLE